MNNLNAMLLCDFYKISHREMYPKGTTKVYSTWTPRTSRLDNINEVVSFGQQAFVKNYLVNFFTDNFFKKPKKEIVSDYKRILKATLGIDADASHIEELHDLGYLPLHIKIVPEGTLVPLRIPTMTIENTNSKFFWLTNYIETLASCELWQASTSATLAFNYKNLLNSYAKETVGDTSFVPFQGHDFSMRGMSSLQSAISSGMGHLLSFVGTDTIPAIQGVEYYYKEDITKTLVGTSIPATEHSIQCAYGDDTKYFNELITKIHPTGFVSIVSDGYDFWDVIGRVVPSLKGNILNREGKVVIRPDSGDPVKVVCGDKEGATELERKGAVEALWDIFGGTITEKGYKLLDSHIGLIYGDAITLQRCEEISKQLKAKGFASINCVYGIGSYTYQYNTRDTFGFALKSTLVEINGVEIPIFKNPKTDDGVKKSQKGVVNVFSHKDGIYLTDFDNNEIKPNSTSLLTTLYKNGIIIEESFSTIKGRLSRS